MYKITHGFNCIFSTRNVFFLIVLFLRVNAEFTWILNLENFLQESSNVLHNGTHGKDIVYIGGVDSHDQSLLYGIDITGTAVPDIQPQLAAGVQAIRDSTAEQIKAYSYHFSNGHLSTRTFRRAPDPYEMKGKFTAVVNYGALQVGTRFVSEIEKWIRTLNGTEFMQRSEIIPIGSTWDSATRFVELETYGKWDSISQSLLEVGTHWANNAIDNHAFQDSYQVAFSRGSWHLCITIANKSYYLTSEETRRATNSIIPQGILRDGGAPVRWAHDEL